jgi:CAAX prenyl protease-like protein
MTWRTRLDSSPGLVRAAPFLTFLGLTFCQAQFGPASKYWFYLAKTLAGAWMVWALRPWIAEMRWRMSWPAVIVGIAVFGIWVGLDGLYPTIDQIGENLGFKSAEHRPIPPWNPFIEYGSNTGVAWFIVGVRILGSSLVVPPIEEVFYRSYLYRYLVRPDFQAVPLGCIRWTPFLLAAGVFGFAHREWLAGILCGLAYQGLVCWKKRLGDAMTAHAVTNFLLGLWVVGKGDWHFW